jgi:hypothetical protein
LVVALQETILYYLRILSWLPGYKFMTNATGAKMALEKELETYNAKLPELKAQEGKYVLIHGDQIVDTYSSYEDAMKEGYTRFKLDKPFLVKQIRSIEQVKFISRLVVPCHTSPSK